MSLKINRLPAFVGPFADCDVRPASFPVMQLYVYMIQKNAGNDDCISGVMMNSAKALSGIICTERTRYPSQREP